MTPLRVLAWPAYANADNPYHALLYAPMGDLGIEVLEYSPAALAGGGWDVLHVHWPEFLLGRRPVPATAAFVARVLRARAAGRRVVWTVHNLAPHDDLPGGRAVYRAVSWLADAVIGHSEASLAAARRRYPALRRRPGVVVPQGHYRDVYPRTCTAADARRSLGLDPDDRVLLYFGSVRAYKRVDRLLAAVARTPGDRLRLVVAGRATPELQAGLEAAAAADPRVQLHLDFVPAEEVARYFAAADVVVLPYEDRVLESAVAMLALSFDRPVLGPDVGSLRELQSTVGAGWVRTFQDLGPSELHDALDAAARVRHQVAPLDGLDWPVLAARTAAAYRAVS